MPELPCPGCAAASQKNPPATSSVPVTISQRTPNLFTIVPLTGASTRKNTDSGISAAPAWAGE